MVRSNNHESQNAHVFVLCSRPALQWPVGSSESAGQMTHEYPLISVVVPNYQNGRFLASIVYQNYPNTECLVMDGGSTDSSASVINRYRRHLSFWRSGPDRGQADAIAEGFHRSTGTILCWLNSDDWFLPGAFLEVASAYAKKESAVGYSGRCVYTTEDGRPFKIHAPLGRTAKSMVLFGHGHAQMATFWYRDAYEAVGGLDATMQFAFDYDLFYRLRGLGEFALVNAWLAAFRLHAAAKTANLGNVRKREDAEIARRYLPKIPPIIPEVAHRLDPRVRLRNACTWYRRRNEIRSLMQNSSRLFDEVEAGLSD